MAYAKRITVGLTRTQADQLAALSEESGASQSAIVSLALTQYLRVYAPRPGVERWRLVYYDLAADPDLTQPQPLEQAPHPPRVWGPCYGLPGREWAEARLAKFTAQPEVTAWAEAQGFALGVARMED